MTQLWIFLGKSSEKSLWLSLSKYLSYSLSFFQVTELQCMRKGLGGFQDSGGSELTIYCIDSCLFLSSSPSSLLSLPALLGDWVAVVDELKRRAEEIPGLRMRRRVRGSQDSRCSKLHPNHPSILLCKHQFSSNLFLPGDIWLWSCSRWEEELELEDSRSPSRRLPTIPPCICLLIYLSSA